LVQQLSVAVGLSKSQTEPHSTILFRAQVRTGGVVSTTVTTWLQLAMFPTQSVINHVCVINCGQLPLVTVFTTAMLTVGQQGDEAIGESNVQPEPHSTVLFVGQVTVNGH